VDIVIHHNPDCGTSRNVLAMIRAAGHDPVIIEYLKTGWTRPQLLALFAAAGLSVRSALRTTRSPAADLGLLDPAIPEATLLDAMLDHPILVNRPIVACKNGLGLCRPSETVLPLLGVPLPEDFTKEDGTPVA
jgi:arsenate reductase